MLALSVPYEPARGLHAPGGMGGGGVACPTRAHILRHIGGGRPPGSSHPHQAPSREAPAFSPAGRGRGGWCACLWVGAGGAAVGASGRRQGSQGGLTGPLDPEVEGSGRRGRAGGDGRAVLRGPRRPPARGGRGGAAALPGQLPRALHARVPGAVGALLGRRHVQPCGGLRVPACLRPAGPTHAQGIDLDAEQRGVGARTPVGGRAALWPWGRDTRIHLLRAGHGGARLRGGFRGAGVHQRAAG
mmetsp:Transcript_9500/g.31152  ORF Transcript_9500/g.31152 Transcript_9500/m.31152 type:complete len:244 (+) Transcript_9500:64-795(+)